MIIVMSENQQITDSELILQIYGYNQNAFEELFNRYSATIYSLIKEIVTNPRLAEKILLNVFSVFLKRLEYYNTDTESVFTWLVLLARNLSIDTLNRIKQGDEFSEYTDEYEIKFILPRLSREITPISIDNKTEFCEKVRTYKSNLTEAQNLTLSLVYFEGLDEEEIAKRLNVPVVTVRQKILSIMENLYEQYTGKTESTSNKEILNLIKVEALGCLSSKEKEILNKVRQNESDFLWKELGEYQNLTALLSLSVPVQNPATNFIEQIRNLFRVIVQGEQGEVRIPEPEPEMVEQVQEPIQEMIQTQPQNHEPVILKQPEVQEKSKPNFELKFRERDPEELSILKKLENIETSIKNEPEVIKEEKKIQFKDYVVPEKKSEIAPQKPVPSVQIKEAVKEIITENKSNENRIFSSNKNELSIENDDPSIVIDEPPVARQKEEVMTKGKLIPNSSINLKELLKKNEVSTNIKTTSTDKLKDEKNVEKNTLTQLADSSDIKIKANLPPQEIKKANLIVDREEKKIAPEISTPVHENVEFKNKKSELNIETKKIEPVQLNETKLKDENDNISLVENSDIKIKSNEPPKEFRKSNVFTNSTPHNTSPKPLQTLTKKPEPLKQNEEVTHSFGKKLNTTITPTPAIDKSKLKIREIKFTEEDNHTTSSKQEIIPGGVETKPTAEKVIPAAPVKTSINVDEIIAKIENAEQEPMTYADVRKFKNRKQKPAGKRKSLFIAAAVIVLLALSSVFLFIDFNGTSEQVATKNPKQEKREVAVESSLVTNPNTSSNSESENISNSQSTETPKVTETIKNTKDVVPPLPEISIKEESTLYASNINENLLGSPQNEETQIAAAKTETSIPPKEKVKIEEEPAFFVAVEEMPELIGGLKTLQSKIKYPEIASRVGVEGKVLVQAVVNESGDVMSVKTIKGIGSGCDEVAMDAVRNSKFTPGKQRGKNVKVQVTIPIVFKK